MGLYIVVNTATSKTMIPHSNIASISLNKNCNVFVNLKSEFGDYYERKLYTFSFGDYTNAEKFYNLLLENFSKKQFAGEFYSSK